MPLIKKIVALLNVEVIVPDFRSSETISGAGSSINFNSGRRQVQLEKIKSNIMSNDKWFEDIFGFPEKGSFNKIQKMFHVSEDGSILTTVPPTPTSTDGSILTSPQRQFFIGNFSTPSVAELRAEISSTLGAIAVASSAPEVCSSNYSTNDGQQRQAKKQRLKFEHMVGDVGLLHRLPENSGAIFQAASQFNCLEMTSPSVKPEHGITQYVYDRTQGPVCALACPGATVFRNYFACGDGRGSNEAVNLVGQGGKNGIQLDLLKDIGQLVGNETTSNANANVYWKMKNGYALSSSESSIQQLSQKLMSQAPDILKELISKLRVGVQWDTEVSYFGYEYLNHGSIHSPLPNPPHRVCQVYCSAVPISYDHPTRAKDWEVFARTILMGLYEATLAVAVIKQLEKARQHDENRSATEQRTKVYLTMVGGGAFGNDSKWIAEAIGKSLNKYQHYPLDVYLVHYGRIDEYYVKKIQYAQG